jgi:AraC-like DNA-binding protein
MKLDLPRASDLDAGVWYSTAASTRYPTHWHDELELNLVLWGRAEYQIGAQTIELGRGSLLLLAPGQQHTLLAVSKDLAMWVASFRADTIRDAEALAGIRLGERNAAYSVCALRPGRLLQLSALHARLASYDEPRQLNFAARQLLVRVLEASREHPGAQEAFGAYGGHSPAPLHAAVARAQILIRAREPVPSLRLLSQRCGLEASRLSRVFKQQMGLSMVQFRNHFRVQHFIRHFGRGEATTMLGAALECGFGSYAQFHRAFHQVTGYAPSEHLRRVRAGIIVPEPQGQPLLGEDA